MPHLLGDVDRVGDGGAECAQLDAPDVLAGEERDDVGEIDERVLLPDEDCPDAVLDGLAHAVPPLVWRASALLPAAARFAATVVVAPRLAAATILARLRVASRAVAPAAGGLARFLIATRLVGGALARLFMLAAAVALRGFPGFVGLALTFLFFGHGSARTSRA